MNLFDMSKKEEIKEQDKNIVQEEIKEVILDAENTENTKINNTEINIVEKEQAREVDKYINALRMWGSSYDVFPIREGSDKYVLCQVSQDGKKITKLTNILPAITKKITYTNGVDEETRYELVGYVLDNNDKKLGPIEIEERELTKLMNTITSNFIGESINYGANSDKKMREVVEIIGRQSVTEKIIYSHTGLIRKNGELRYLYHGGNIGVNENNEIETDLTDYNIQQYCFTDKEFDLRTALEIEYSLLELADLKIMIPLIATTFLSPLFSLLQEEGIIINYVLMIVGKTGTYKSSSAAIMLCHFGNFTVNTLPLSFRATFAGIEKVAFAAKDTILVVDDYKPETMETDQERIMESILGLWGDRNNRIKMNSKGGLHQKYSPRGLVLVTGERPPKFSQSRLARAITVYTQEGSIDFNKLKEIYAKKEQLSFIMKEFIKWIISNEEDIRNKVKELQAKYSTRTESLELHPRIKQNICVMMMGFIFWLDFMLENQIIDSTTRDKLKEEAYQVLEEVGRNQQSDVEDEDPVKVFFKTIGQLQVAEKVYFTDYKTGVASETATGTHIGYIDNETNQYYLIADVIYKEVEKACIGKFIVTQKQLRKSLADDGYIVTDKDNRKVIRKTDPKTKNKVEVLIVPKQKWNEAMGYEDQN